MTTKAGGGMWISDLFATPFPVTLNVAAGFAALAVLHRPARILA